MKPWDVVIIGAGAAGLMAATEAAQRWPRVLLLEKNSKTGVKILISGGTRCNLTHATDARGIASAFEKKQANFLRSPLSALGPEQLIDLFESEGVKTKIESATGKVFPFSDRAIDVAQALRQRLHKTKCEVIVDCPVKNVQKQDNFFNIKTEKRSFESSRLIITVGGQSYPGCGTTGDGYAWAKSLGHTITPTFPALVPITLRDEWLSQLTGIAFQDAIVSVINRDHRKATKTNTCRDALLITHFGISGPAPMNVSRFITTSNDPDSRMRCDFLPKISEDEIRESLFPTSGAGAGRRSVINSMPNELPRRFRELLLDQLQVPLDTTLANLKKQHRNLIVENLKRGEFRVHGTRGYKKAEVTAGGVHLKEVDSKTMQSKLVPNLYFAGEILDIDGPIGGYNFQAAFSTGWLAGRSC